MNKLFAVIAVAMLLLPLESAVFAQPTGSGNANYFLYTSCNDLISAQENVTRAFTAHGSDGTGDYSWQVNVYTNDSNLAFQQVLEVQSYKVASSYGYFFLENLVNGGYSGQTLYPTSTLYPDTTSLSINAYADEVLTGNPSTSGLQTFYWEVYSNGVYQTTYSITTSYYGNEVEQGIQSILVGDYNGHSANFSGGAGYFYYTGSSTMYTAGDGSGNGCSGNNWWSVENSNVTYGSLTNCQQVASNGPPGYYECTQSYTA